MWGITRCMIIQSVMCTLQLVVHRSERKPGNIGGDLKMSMFSTFFMFTGSCSWSLSGI